MAKQCTACNRFYLAALDSCPNCGSPAYGPAGESWPAIRSSGSLPAPHMPLEPLPPAELSAGPDADSSPLAPLPKRDCPPRFVIKETEIEADSVGELSADPEYLVGLHGEPKAPAAGIADAVSDSEIDLRLIWNEEEGPLPDPTQWERDRSTRASVPEDFGVHLLEAGGQVEPRFGIDIRENADITCKADPDINLTGEGRPDLPGDDPAALPGIFPVAADAGASLDVPPEAEQVQFGSGKATQDWPGPDTTSPDSVTSDDELAPGSMAPHVAAPVSAGPPVAAVPAMFFPAVPPKESDGTRLSSALLGVLIGAAACFALWLCGLEPPSSLRLSGASNSKAITSLATPNSAKEQIKPEAQEPPPTNEINASDEFAESLTRDFGRAIELAEARRYPAAIVALQQLSTSLEQRRALDEAQERFRDHDEAELALLKTCDQLRAAWQLEEQLARQGILPAQRNSLAAVQNILANDKLLKQTLEALDAKFKTTTAGSGNSSLDEKLDRLIKARADAERQAALVPVERQRAQDAGRAAEAALVRASALEDKLRATEGKLQRTEHKLKEVSAKQELARRASPIVLPPLKLVQARDEKLAYQHYAKGLRAYQEGHFLDAEKEFQSAVASDDQDARYHYYLGLARWSQGKRDDAATHFRQGARLERDNLPSQVFVKLALEQVNGEALKDMNRFRPQQ